MRVVVRGGSEGQRSLIRRALASGGCTPVDTADQGDLVLTLGPDGGAASGATTIELDPVRGLARRGDRVARLSRIEVAMLGALLASERPLRRRDLIARVWGYEFDPGTNIVAVHIGRLRAKLGADAIVRVGHAYRLGQVAPGLSADGQDAIASAARGDRSPARCGSGFG